MNSQSDLDPKTVTILLDRASEGDCDAVSEVWSHMFTEVHRIAKGYAAREGATPSIQASMLINEVYLRLFGGSIPQWNNRNHFLNTIAHSMGNYLKDRARARNASKRGGNRKQTPLTIAVGELANYNTAQSIEASEIVQAIDVLETESPEAAQVARLRFMLGLSVELTAESMGIAQRTVTKKWAYAKAWLRRHVAMSRSE